MNWDCGWFFFPFYETKWKEEEQPELPGPREGVPAHGVKWCLRSLPTQVFLWFHEKAFPFRINPLWEVKSIIAFSQNAKMSENIYIYIYISKESKCKGLLWRKNVYHIFCPEEELFNIATLVLEQNWPQLSQLSQLMS